MSKQVVHSTLLWPAALGGLLISGCKAETERTIPAAASVSGAGADTPVNQIARRLSSGDLAFGIFSGDHTEAQGASMAGQEGVDFIFYDLETGVFDIPQMEAYLRGLHATSGAAPSPPVLLRIPPIRELGPERAQDYVRQGLEVGVGGLVFPHVVTAVEAKLAAAFLGEDLWPRNSRGGLVNVVIIEDREAVDRVGEIAKTAGVSVVLLGPNDLLLSYGGDAAALENGIQAVLAACKEIDVPCGITATVDDIGQRIDQGFRLLLVREPAALVAGLTAAGRR